MSKRLRLGDMLVAAGMVTEAQVEEALAAQKGTGKKLGETLVHLGYVTEAQMTQALSNQLTIPWVNLYHVDFSRELLDLVPAEVAEKWSIVPVYVRHVRRQGDTLYVAMDDPMNLGALQEVADGSGLPVKPMVASPSDIRNAIRVYYLGLPPLGEEPELELAPVGGGEVIEDATLLEDLVSSKPPPQAKSSLPPPPEEEEDETPSAHPSVPPPARPGGFVTLTLLDGTVVKLPSHGDKKKKKEAQEERGLTTRDLIHALQARAAGKDVSDVLPQDAWEPLVATLLAILLRKGLVADWEIVNEWKKQRQKVESDK